MGLDLKGSFSTPPTTQWQIRAWALANGNGTAHIDASSNFSSLTDNGSGDYTFNFSTNMPDTAYVVTGSTGRNSTPHFSLNSNIRNASNFRINTGTWASGFNPVNCDSIMLIVCK
tara:strand:+ start:117 stop:461 length:345 start_codon:yes stop_codon:yes gene_type:complete